MLILYYKPTCPYSQAVLAEAETLNLSFNLKDISSDEVLLAELMEKGGKKQTPYLVDPEREVEMYESNDIAKYLHEHYGKDTAKESFGGLRIHKSDEACDTCQ